jgi:membrane protein required for colicin V production
MTPDALDITVAGVLILSAIFAYFRGLIREVFTIGALIAASGAAYAGGGLMLPAFEKWLHVDQDASKIADQQAADAVSKAASTGADPGMAKTQLVMGVIGHEHMAQLCAYASVFFFIYMVMSLIGYFLARAITEAGLGVIDRLLGAGFGFARGFVLVLLAYLPFWYYYQDRHDPMPAWATSSISVPVLDKSVEFVDKNLGLGKIIAKQGDEVVKKLKDREAKKRAAGEDAAELHKPAPAASPASMNGQEPPDEQGTQAADKKELQNELTDEERKTPP